MRYTGSYTAILLMGVMILNVVKYQLLHIEYNLFRDYIAENLCVKRCEVNNDCQGKCFLDRQINTVSETENDANNTTKKQQISFDDYIVNEFILQKPFFTQTQLTSFVITYVSKVNADVPVPPPNVF